MASGHREEEEVRYHGYVVCTVLVVQTCGSSERVARVKNVCRQ